MNKSEVEKKVDFSLIRYAQCWEDADILIKALNIDSKKICLSIGSAGDNAIALLTRSPKKVIAIDLSQAQIECIELRVAAYRQLEYHELLEFMGSKKSNRRRELLQKCTPALKPATIEFWYKRIKSIEKYGLGGVGKFENYFRIFKNYVLPLVHSKTLVNKFLQQMTREEREILYIQRWDSWRWRLLLKIFFSKSIMGRHGRDKAFFEYVHDSVPEHISRRTKYAMTVLDPVENPYLQWILTGFHTTALPVSLREENFEIIRKNLDRLEWRCQSIEEFTISNTKIDAFNLSDIFEYIGESEFEKLYGNLIKISNPKARLAYWNMMVPRKVPVCFESNILQKRQLADELYSEDKAFFYSRFIVEEVI